MESPATSHPYRFPFPSTAKTLDSRFTPTTLISTASWEVRAVRRRSKSVVESWEAPTSPAYGIATDIQEARYILGCNWLPGWVGITAPHLSQVPIAANNVSYTVTVTKFPSAVAVSALNTVSPRD